MREVTRSRRGSRRGTCRHAKVDTSVQRLGGMGDIHSSRETQKHCRNRRDVSPTLRPPRTRSDRVTSNESCWCHATGARNGREDPESPGRRDEGDSISTEGLHCARSLKTHVPTEILGVPNRGTPGPHNPRSRRYGTRGRWVPDTVPL